MLTSETIKEFAVANGADIVGIGSMDRFEGTVPEQDPRFIAPKATSIIGLGFRVPRGSLRGAEEGTQYYQFPEMGIVHIDEVHGPMVLRRVSCFLEDHGFEGVVQRTVPDRRPESDSGTNPELNSTHKISFSEPVDAGKPAPDVLMDFNQAARICGLGEIGKGGFFLTERFGPLQRFAFVLTDSDLEPDPVVELKLCDQCGDCVAACPGKAISDDGELDEWQCLAYRLGADVKSNPFLSEQAVKVLPDGKKILSGEMRFDQASVEQCRGLWSDAYPSVRFGYTPALCAVACQRACLAKLEERGVLKDKFKNKFRTP